MPCGSCIGNSTALHCEREREIVIIIVTKREGEQRVKVVEFFFPHLLSKREHHPVRASVCVCAGAYITVGIDDDERIKGESTSGREEGRKEGEKSEWYVKKKRKEMQSILNSLPLFKRLSVSVSVCVYAR